MDEVDFAVICCTVTGLADLVQISLLFFRLFSKATREDTVRTLDE